MIYLMADWFFSSTFTEIIKVLLSIDSIIYWLIAQFFAFIIDVASSEFVMSDLINSIINRTYIVVGVFALFIMSYSLIKGMFDPDGALKGKNSVGSIVKNLLIAIALVALMPTIFQYLFRFQSIIVNNNVIGAIVLGNDKDGMKFKVLEYGSDGNVVYENGQPKYHEVDVTIDNVGYENYVKVSANNVAFSALNAFIYADDDTKPIDLSEKVTIGTILNPTATATLGISSAAKVLESVIRDNSGDNETTFATLKNNIIISGNFLALNSLSYHIATGGDYANGEGAHVSYMFVVSTIGGIVMLVLAFTFAINLVIRMFNLFLLELVSPIASFSLIIPNSKIFSNWLKAVMKEYFDIFIRLFTFNLAILFFSNIQSIISQASTISSGFNLLNLFFVIGLLIFINEAPKLVKDIFGIKDDKKSIKSRLFTGAVASTIGGALGLAGGLAGSAIGATHALADKETKGLHKAWNTVKGVGSGISTGQAAAKSKKFSDFTGAVSKGVTAADTNRKKGDLYFKQHGSSLGGVITGKAHDAMGYVTGLDASHEWEKYKANQDASFGVIDSAKKDIEAAVEKSKVTRVINGESRKVSISDLKDQRDLYKEAYNKQLIGTERKSLSEWKAETLSNLNANCDSLQKSIEFNYSNEMNKIRGIDTQINATTDQTQRNRLIAQRESIINGNAGLKTALAQFNKADADRVSFASKTDAEINADYEAANKAAIAAAYNAYEAADKDYKAAQNEAINAAAKDKGSKVQQIIVETSRKLEALTNDNEYATNIDDGKGSTFNLYDYNLDSDNYDHESFSNLHKAVKDHTKNINASDRVQDALKAYKESKEKKDK